MLVCRRGQKKKTGAVPNFFSLERLKRMGSWEERAESLVNLSLELNKLHPIDYSDDTNWWDVDYVANGDAKRAILNIRENMDRLGLSFRKTKDAVDFVKNNSNPEEAYRIMESIVNDIDVFSRRHNNTTWQTIDLSHAKLMHSLFKWKGDYLEPVVLYKPMWIFDRQYLVVTDKENDSLLNEECEELRDIYTAQTTVMKIALERNSLLRVSDLPMFLESCTPLDKIVPNLDKVIEEQLAHINACIQYFGSERFVERSLFKFATNMVSAIIILHNIRGR